MSEYTMTLREALKKDPTIFDFEYSPKIEIQGVDLKDYVKAYYMEREIGQETISKFKWYLQRDFLVNAQWLYDKLNAFTEANKLDQLVSNRETHDRTTDLTENNTTQTNGKSKGTGTNNSNEKYYATPVSGYDSNDVESTRTDNSGTLTNNNESTMSVSGNGSSKGTDKLIIERITDLPMVAYAKYEAGYLNVLDVFLKHFDKLFMRIY